MARESKTSVVSGAQLLMRTDVPGLQIDGIWGPMTTKAYFRAEQTTREKVNDFVARGGWSIDAFVATPTWISSEDAMRFAGIAAAKHDIPMSAMMYMLEREPQTKSSPQGVLYRVNGVSPSGLHYGLYQIGKPAWTDAQRIDPSIGDFATNWHVPQQNSLAAAAFAVANMRYAKTLHGYSGPFTDEVIYAMHNQGHTFIAAARKGALGRWSHVQSQPARQTLALARDQVQAA